MQSVIIVWGWKLGREIEANDDISHVLMQWSKTVFRSFWFEVVFKAQSTTNTVPSIFVLASLSDCLNNGNLYSPFTNDQFPLIQ